MAFTDIGDAVVGAVAPASWGDAVRENFLLAGPHLIVRKPSDESVTSSTALQDDNHLILPVLANEVWKLNLEVIYSASTTGDFKFGFTFPTGGRLDVQMLGLQSAVVHLGGFSVTTSPSGTDNFDGLGSTAHFPLPIWGIYTNGANAGNLTLQWAQQASDATATTVYANSTLWAVKLA